MSYKDIRIGVKICMKDTGEEVCDRFIKPNRLMQELEVIQGNKHWKITETWIANGYGIRLEDCL